MGFWSMLAGTNTIGGNRWPYCYLDYHEVMPYVLPYLTGLLMYTYFLGGAWQNFALALSLQKGYR
jgi:hypothetical protein